MIMEKTLYETPVIETVKISPFLLLSASNPTAGNEDPSHGGSWNW